LRDLAIDNNRQALMMAALIYDEDGQEDETQVGRSYYKALATAARALVAAIDAYSQIDS
jgi:hypothetical protein